MSKEKDAVLTFRVETSCTFRDTFFKATDEEGGELHQFPAGLILDVPQHFSAVKGGWTSPDAEGNRKLVDMGPDDETNELREAYFATVLPLNANANLDEAKRHTETARIKANFLEYGQAEAPKAPEAPEAPKAPEAMTKIELVEELTALKAEFDPKSKNADLVPLLVAARAKAAGGGE